MRKLLVAILVISMVFGITGCGNKKSTTESSSNTVETSTENSESTSNSDTDEKGIIGFSTLTLGNEFFASLDESFHKKFEAEGYEVVTVSCEMNPTTQVSDIENLITMGCDTIFLFVVDAQAIIDVLVKAREAGIQIIPIATTISNRDAYDKIMGTDQYATGTGCAEIASDWVDKTFLDAADGTVEVAIIGLTGSEEAIKRTNGLKTISDINKKVKVVEVFDLSGASDGGIKAQEYAELMTSKYPNLKCVLDYGSGDAIAVNEVYMRQAGLDISQFGIFGVDTTEPVLNAIKDSMENKAALRGTISFGMDLAGDMYNVFLGKWDNLIDENGYINLPVEKVTTENIEDFLAKLQK